MSTPTPNLTQGLSPEARLSQARKLYSLARWQEAKAELEPLLVDYPAYADLHNMAGVCAHHLGHWPQAEAAFNEALRINPRYTEAALNLAVLLNDTGRYDAARVVYRQALEVLSQAGNAMDPVASGKIANMHADLAQAYREAHRPEEAQAEYQRALALRPTFADIRHQLAGLLIEQKQLEAAVGQLQRCIADQPAYIQARLRLGGALLALSRPQEAQLVYEAVLAMDAKQSDALRGLRLAQTAQNPTPGDPGAVAPGGAGPRP